MTIEDVTVTKIEEQNPNSAHPPRVTCRWGPGELEMRRLEKHQVPKDVKLGDKGRLISYSTPSLPYWEFEKY